MLGRGGMGSVWEAYHIALETEIAIKFLDPSLSNRTDIRSRFAQEATAAARIKSPHVVSILDYGFTEDGRGFIAMELLKGEDLAQRIDRLGGLTPPETAEIVVQACRGLAKAHASNIVHRDLKPENLFVVEDDDGVLVKILDFGIAKAVGLSGSTHKTDTGQILGTPLYMSPEQALGRPIDSRSDLYSLAVVAYRCLAGRPPFVCDAVGELIVAVSTLVPPPPSAFNVTLPASLDAWFAGMLLKDPNARSCQTARDLADSFEAACRSLQSERASSASARAPANAYTPTVPETPSDGMSAQGAQRTEAGVSAGVRPAILPGSTVPTPDTLRSERAPRGRIVGTGIALLGAAGVLALTLRSGPGAPAPEPPVEAAPTQAPSPHAAAPIPDVSLRVSAHPPNARLLLDGAPLPGNPHVGARPPDRLQHVLRAEAPGHEPEERTLLLDRSVQLDLVLKPLPAAAPEKPAAPTPPAAAAARPRAPAGRPALPVSAAPAAAPPAAPTPTPPPATPKSPFEIDRTDPWKH
jgi:serine/threonine-protein kinase